MLSLAFSAGLLAQPGPPDRVAVIIGFERQPGASEEALVRAAGGTVKHNYRIIPAIAATLPQRAIEALSNHPLVSVIEPDVRLYALNDYEYEQAWGVAKIGAKLVHETSPYNKGAGLKVCVIDSGIDRYHPDLAGNFLSGKDYVNNDDDPADDNGHGTHVAGSIAAVLNGSGVVGVAPEAKILAYKILDASGSGYFSNAIKAVEDCEAAGGKITNNSYGSSQDPGTLVKQAFENTYSAGILHVAAAGNATFFTCNKVSYPGKYDSVIAVGATDSSDTIASFSCKGAEVELAAPGVGIKSTFPGNTYAIGDGTSMASPHVAGLAALVFNCGLKDLNGDKLDNTNIDVRLRMQQTALDLGAAGRDTSYGFGRVQANLAALNCGAQTPQPSVPNAPSNLNAAVLAKNAIALTWSDNSDNETNFEVWRCTGSGCASFALIATLPADTTTYTNNGLKRSTTYGYKVRATNSGGKSAYAGPVYATTTAR